MAAQRDLVIGLDSSTTACKAMVWDRDGYALAVGRASLSMDRPRPSWHEQSAEQWWEAATTAIREAARQVDHRRLAGLAISAQRETFVVSGPGGQPLRSAFLWMDERCREFLPALDRLYGKDRIHQETGKPLSANLSLGKLYWMREREPSLFSQITQVLDVHAYLAMRLTGRPVTAWGCADPMGLFDMRNSSWDRELIESIGLRLEQFPEALPSGALIGKILASSARACGLPDGLPLIAGLGDGQAAGLGVNVTQPGDAYLNLGTAVVSGTYSDNYLVDPAFRTMYGGVPGSFMLETVLLGGTYTISWFIEQFADQEIKNLPSGMTPEMALEERARQVPPGAMGLVLVPYWNGALNPYWDASASGIIVGWRGIHGKAHLYRAILEGVAMEIRLHLEGVEKARNARIERLIAVGGGARSSLWCQVIADVTGKPVTRAQTPGKEGHPQDTLLTEASALGAGILAAAGSGLFPDVPSAARHMTHSSASPFTPESRGRAFYHRLYEEVYRPLFPAVQPILHRLTDINEAQDLATGEDQAGSGFESESGKIDIT